MSVEEHRVNEEAGAFLRGAVLVEFPILKSRGFK